MTYDESLAQRVRKSITGAGRIEEKTMFGGLTFMVDGKMCCGVETSRLMVRLDPARESEYLSRPGARPMDFTGRPMRGFIFVDAATLRKQSEVDWWVREALSYVRSKTVRKKR